MKSYIPIPRLSFGLLLGTLVLSGCSTVVKQSFEGDPASSTLKLASYSGTSTIYGSVDPVGDSKNLVDGDYARLGVSSFKTDGHVTYEELQSEAQDIGADIVLFTVRKPGIGQALPPMTVNRDGTAHSLAPYTHVNSMAIAGGNYGGATSVGGGMQNFNGSVTSSGIPGISASDMAAINAQSYEYTVSFWRKTTKG
jgi:hypothetical protein